MFLNFPTPIYDTRCSSCVYNKKNNKCQNMAIDPREYFIYGQ